MVVDISLDLSTAVFLDTSLIVAATVEAHPSHDAAANLSMILFRKTASCASDPQICREFLVVLTRQPVSGRSFTTDEAIAVLEVWRTGCIMLDETETVVQECLSLVRRHGVLGKQIHDCNLVATMVAHGIGRLATRNPADFKRFHAEISVLSVTG